MNQKAGELIYRLAANIRGEETFRLLDEYRKSQWWSAQTFEQYFDSSLKSLITYAAKDIPFYRQGAFSEFVSCPVITKLELKQNPEEFSNPKLKVGCFTKTTSGSTGQPVSIVKDREAMASEQAATYRCYEWAGIFPGARQGRFWGVAINNRGRVINSVRDMLLNRKRFSAFNLSEETLEIYYKELLAWNPVYLYGYQSTIASLASFIRDTGKTVLPRGLKAIVTTSEILTNESRHLIEGVFGVRVFNEYGCGEVGTIAHECEHGKLHVNCENVYVEILDEANMPCAAGDGRVVVTELHNKAMPLIRYELGDYAAWDQSTCPCGRGLKVLKNVYGRAYDIIVGPNGVNSHPEFFLYIVESINSRSPQIKQFQFVQQNEKLIVRIVKDKLYAAAVEEEIKGKIKEKFGDYFSFSFEYVDAIERESTGKMRLVKRIVSHS